MRRPSLGDEQRGQLADDVRRLAGFADATVDQATRLAPRCPRASSRARWSDGARRGGWRTGPETARASD
jgi:hypothetical protein